MPTPLEVLMVKVWKFLFVVVKTQPHQHLLRNQLRRLLLVKVKGLKLTQACLLIMKSYGPRAKPPPAAWLAAKAAAAGDGGA